MSAPTDPRREAPLNLSPEAFREVGHALVDRIAEGLEAMPRGPVTRAPSPEDVRTLVQAGRGMPREGVDPGPLLLETADRLFEHSLHNGHPRFLGYITSSAAPIGMLGDLLAAAVNPNCGAWVLSPVASEIEGQTVRWIAELLGYPVGCGGLLLSGGNMANTACFWAARVAAAGETIRTAGPSAGTGELRIYASSETHTWLQKAADLSGIGTDAIRWLAPGRDLRLDPGVLAAAIDEDLAAGLRPMMAVGTGGSVSTGAVDPLRELSAVCRARDVWFHVDGAYGAFAAMLPDAPEDLRCLELADSIAVDPHKWLYAPLEAGCALVREPEHLRAAFSYHPPYYHFGQGATNYFDLGPQNSRGFRALKVWLALQQAGRAGYERMLAEDIRLARLLHAEMASHPDIEVHECGLSISTFRYVPDDLEPHVAETDADPYLNRLNQEIQARLEQEGELFLSNAVVGGRYLLRGCIVNFRTRESDIRAMPGIVARVGRRTHLELVETGLAGFVS